MSRLLPILLLLGTIAWAEDPPSPPPPAGKEEVKTDPAVVDPAVERIEEEYNAIKSNQDLRQTRRRRELAQRLGYLKSEESTKILLKIVENDRDLRAVITGMEALARVGDLKAIKRMYKHVKREARRSVLPDYFGPSMTHATDPEVGPWLVEEVLDSPNKLLKISAVEAVGSLRCAGAVEPLLEILAKEDKKTRPDMHMRYETLRALGQIGGDRARAVLMKAADDGDWRNRLAAAEVLLVHFRDDDVLTLMRKLLKDDEPIVRELAAVAAGETKQEPLFEELILLMREGNLRAKHKCYEALKAISGKDFGYAPDIWAKWHKDKEQGELDAKGEMKERATVATYYNFKIFSDRVLFIVDVSGSMKWPDYHPNRIEVAKRELRKAVKALDEKSLFNLATFAGHVNMWKDDGEVAATPENKAAALEWIERSLLPRGATNTYDALMEGLRKNPRIDTMYFLSDGIPSTGDYEVPEEILIKLRYENRFRKVIINTVAIAMGKPSIEKAEKYEDPDEMAAFMKLIADWNGGTCVDIREPIDNLRPDD